MKTTRVTFFSTMGGCASRSSEQTPQKRQSVITVGANNQIGTTTVRPAQKSELEPCAVDAASARPESVECREEDRRAGR